MLYTQLELAASTETTRSAHRLISGKRRKAKAGTGLRSREIMTISIGTFQFTRTRLPQCRPGVREPDS